MKPVQPHEYEYGTDFSTVLCVTCGYSRNHQLHDPVISVDAPKYLPVCCSDPTPGSMPRVTSGNRIQYTIYCEACGVDLLNLSYNWVAIEEWYRSQ